MLDMQNALAGSARCTASRRGADQPDAAFPFMVIRREYDGNNERGDSLSQLRLVLHRGILWPAEPAPGFQRPDSGAD
jgi:hypothetical protein